MHRHVMLSVNQDISLNGTLIPSGLYHGHEIWRMSKPGRKVILEKHNKNGRLGVYGIVPYDVTALLGGNVTMTTSHP